MPNWAFGTVKVTGTREGVKSFVERFISSDDQSTVPGKRFFARSFSEQKREQSVRDAMEEFEGKADNETAEHSFLIMFAWSVWSCMIDGYPQRNDAECITLSEACMEDHVAVEIRSTETGMCFEEHVTCDEDGNLNHAERDLSRCKCATAARSASSDPLRIWTMLSARNAVNVVSTVVRRSELWR